MEESRSTSAEADSGTADEVEKVKLDGEVRARRAAKAREEDKRKPAAEAAGFLKHETWRELENQAATGAAGRAATWRRWRIRRPTRPAMNAAPIMAATVEASGTGAGTIEICEKT